MEAWWGRLSFDGMPAFRDPDDGMIWVWDPESKTYTKKEKVDQPDRGHATGGDNALFDPFVHTEMSGVPELEGHMAGWNDNTLYGTWFPSGDRWYLCDRHSKMYGGRVEDRKDTQRGECEFCIGEGREPEQTHLAQEYIPEGQVKCPNCGATTDLPQCPDCGKGLTPEWNKEPPTGIDFNAQPHNPASEFTSWPDREPKRNRMKTDDSFPSMLSKVPSDTKIPQHWAGWGEPQTKPEWEGQEQIPLRWDPKTPGKSFDEMEAMLERYGRSQDPCETCEGTGDRSTKENGAYRWDCSDCDATGFKPGRKPGQQRRKVGNNSWLERRPDGSIALRLHNTDVVTWHPDKMILDTGGWHSRTTRDRMNYWIPGQVWTEKKNQHIAPPSNDPYNRGTYDYENSVDWYDKMELDYQGNVLPQQKDQNYRDQGHYYSSQGYRLAQKISSHRLSQDEWEQWFGEGGEAKTEIGKWIQDSSGQLYQNQGLNTFHEDIARQNNVQWPSGVGAIGSVYNDNTADIQRVFPGAAVDQAGIQAQLQQVFGPVTLQGPVSAESAEEKGTTFQPVIITSGQFVLQNATLPISGQAWVKERSNGVPYRPEYILVAEHLLTDDYQLYAGGAKAIITATGGLTSHAAQLATSDGYPVVVGIGQDYNKIETGNHLKIDPTSKDITVLPYLTAQHAPEEARQFQDSLKQYDRQRNPQYYEDNLPTFSHYDEELAWKQANEPKLDGCPECDAPMAERDGEKFCPDCGHKQPIITVQTKTVEKTAFAPAALALLGRLGLSGGAAAAGAGEAGAVGGAAAAPGGIGSLMKGALSPRNMLMTQGAKSMIPGQQGGQPTIAPGAPANPAPNAWMQGTISNLKTAIPLTKPEEEPIYVPEPKPIVLPDVDPGEEERKRREREREREKEKPQKVPAIATTSAFGEEEVGLGTKNRGEDSDPEHDGSGASFEEKGDSPELLKDVDGEGNAKGDPDQETPQAEQGGGDPQKALELFDANLPLIIEFATSEDDGSTHPILMALDEILEAAFPGYKDAVDEAIETVEETTGVDIDSDEETNEPDELDNSEDDDFDKAASVGDLMGVVIDNATGQVIGQFIDTEADGRIRYYSQNGTGYADPSRVSVQKAGSVMKDQLLWHYGWDMQTQPNATPAPTMPVPGQSGTCPLCGQSHMPGTPCPTMQNGPMMQQPGAAGGISPVMQPQQNFMQPGVQPKVVTKVVEADASHLLHQHDESDYGDFDETLDRPDVKADMTDVDDSETAWVDDNGDPLVEGQDYELVSSEYAIPDRITVEQIHGDEMVFTIHSGDVDYRDQLSKDDIDTFGYVFTNAETDGVDSISDFEMEDDPIRPGHDALPQEDDLTEPATVVSSLENYIGSFQGDNPNNRDWLVEGGSVDVDPELMAKLAGKDYSPREQREFIDEQGTARNLEKLDLEGTHYVMDDDLGTGDTLW